MKIFNYVIIFILITCSINTFITLILFFKCKKSCKLVQEIFETIIIFIELILILNFVKFRAYFFNFKLFVWLRYNNATKRCF